MVSQLFCRRVRTISDYARAYLSKKPAIGKEVFIASGSRIVGDVRLGDCSSVWFNAVLRADINSIEIGHNSNIQDGVVIHVTRKLKVSIGDYVSVGHNAVLHGCTIEDNVLVGMGAVVLDGSRVGANSIVAAGSLIAPGKQIPPNSLVMGSPARVVRSIDAEQVETDIIDNARRYVAYARDHMSFREDNNN